MSQPIFYVVRHQSASDLLALQNACRQLNLPDPLATVDINGQQFSRTFCLEKPTSMLPWRKNLKTDALAKGLAILSEHQLNASLDVQLIPVNLVWGRTPTKEKQKASVGTLLADQESPNWLRKFFIVLFLGRHTLVRFSNALSLRYMADHHGSDEKTAQKLLRVARFHFHRQTIATTGPRLMHRQQMFTALMAKPAIKKLIDDEVKNKGTNKEKVKKQALAIMDEIAGDYRDATIRFGERILSWLWKRLYKGIEVSNAEPLRKLAQAGHEIIYVPCHRSHMDYLLLTYIIYHEGLVTPRIAAGINLNFWPAGIIFRKAGAFFIRRSFNGNRLYSTIFREYLSLLFERGYPVKYYAEGGRSRTGKILPPKTGMLAMTVQSLLHGINRPLTLVPVYIGYEHVMEVATYHRELSGSKKQKESIVGVIKAIRNLRNYGKGYVNFGQPINVNQFLNKQAPDWRSAIDPIDPQKPSWLNPSVKVLAHQVMTSVNQSAALNGVALTALIILASEHKALTKTELATQLDFLLNLQRQVPYSSLLTMPSETGAQLIDQVIALNKVTVNADSYGDIISLEGSSALEMSYYRNNILHCFILPALVCRMLDRTSKISSQQLLEQVITLMNLLSADLFLWQEVSAITEQVEQLLAMLEQNALIKQSKAGFWSVNDDTDLRAKVRLLGLCVDETMQRLAILTNLIVNSAELTKSNLETEAVAIAQRLAVINHSHAPEFTDKRAHASLINAMKEQGFIHTNEQGKLVPSETMIALNMVIKSLVSIEVLQSITL